MLLPTAVTVVVALIGVIVFFHLRNFLAGQIRWDSSYLLPALIIALIGAAAFGRVNYRNFPSIFRILTRTTAVGILVYLLFEPPDFTLADHAQLRVATLIDVGYWFALTVSALSLWRPSFLYPAALYVIATRYVVDDISGFGISTLDIKYMVEMAEFLAMSACVIALLRISVERFGKWPGAKFLALIDLRLLALCLAFIAIGFHFGNYFWSGVAKLLLGPNPWSWALENQTQNMMLGALKRGVLPSGASPLLTQRLFDGLGNFVWLSNTFVLATQLLALIAAVRVNWLRISTLAYDALHIGIFIFGGLFFWPWVWNNVSILIALRQKADYEIGWAPKFCCVVVILLGGSHTYGASARLAWWDVLDFKIPIIQAHTEDGAWVDVPVSYFLSHSYAVSHGYLDLAKTRGHYFPTLWGSVGSWHPHSYERQKTSGKCSEPPDLASPEAQDIREKRLERVARFIRAHHRKMVQRADERGHYSFYLRSHHHPSNPWMYREFNALDIRKIDRYRLLTQSVCLSISKGRLLERIVKEDTVVIAIDGS